MLNNRQNLTNQQLMRVQNSVEYLLTEDSYHHYEYQQNPNSLYQLDIDELIYFFSVLRDTPNLNLWLSKINYYSLLKNDKVIVAAFNALSNNTTISSITLGDDTKYEDDQSISDEAIESIVNLLVKNKNLINLDIMHTHISIQALLKILAAIKDNKVLQSLDILLDYHQTPTMNLEDNQYEEILNNCLNELLNTLNLNKTVIDLKINIEVKNSTDISLLSEYLSRYDHLQKLDIFIIADNEDVHKEDLLSLLKIIEVNDLIECCINIASSNIKQNNVEIIKPIIKNRPNLINFEWPFPKDYANNEISNIINANIKQAGKLLLKALKLIDPQAKLANDILQIYCVIYYNGNYNYYDPHEFHIKDQVEQLALAREILNTKPAIFEILNARRNLKIEPNESFESLSADYKKEGILLLPDSKEDNNLRYCSYQPNLILLTTLYPSISNDQLPQHFSKQLDQRLNQIIIDQFQPNTDFTNNLDKVSTRYQQLQDKLAKLSKLNLTDTSEFKQLSTEYSDLVPIVKKINELIISDKLPDDCLRLILEFADDQSKVALIDKINQIKAVSREQINRQPAEPAAESHANRHLKHSGSFTQNLTEQSDTKRAKQR